jgi:sulfatase maturation enzyme AslB (radical SAM superfamily)
VTHSIHDFTGKLRQPSLRAQVEAYVAWRRELAVARARGLPDPDPPSSAPISINLDLTTACNYRCDHCIDWDILNSKHRHDEERLRRSIELMAGRGLRSVIVIGGGEPTLYPGFCGFVRFLKELRLQIAIVSNGSRGDRLLEVAERLEEGDWIRLSLDSGSNELFAAMHRPVSRSVTLDAICAWIPRIKACNPKVRVGFSFIIVWSGAERSGVEIHENIHEIVLAAERAKRHGFDYIAFKPVLERGPDGDEVMDPLRAKERFDEAVARIGREVDRARTLAAPGFEVYESTNLRLLRQGAWTEFTRQPRTCHMQALRQVLSPTGLFNCPAHRGVAKARVAGSDAYEDGEKAERTAQALASLLDQFDASQECSRVTCLYNPVNWWLEKMIEEPRRDLEGEPSPERFDHFL